MPHDHEKTTILKLYEQFSLKILVVQQITEKGENHMASILWFNGKSPSIADGVFLAPDAQIIGDVTIEEGSSIWFGAVIRGDFGPIHIGKYTSIQDNCVVPVTEKGTRVGDYNPIGHGAVLHECQ